MFDPRSLLFSLPPAIAQCLEGMAERKGMPINVSVLWQRLEQKLDGLTADLQQSSQSLNSSFFG